MLGVVVVEYNIATVGLVAGLVCRTFHLEIELLFYSVKLAERIFVVYQQFERVLIFAVVALLDAKVAAGCEQIALYSHSEAVHTIRVGLHLYIVGVGEFAVYYTLIEVDAWLLVVHLDFLFRATDVAASQNNGRYK